MALILGVHIIAKGNREMARDIARDIVEHQRLLIGSNTMYGAGVYAWQEEFLPVHLADQPQVIFEIDDRHILLARHLPLWIDAIHTHTAPMPALPGTLR